MDPRYPHSAETDRSVRPELVSPDVYGHHASIGTPFGKRKWGFEQEKGRDRFLADVKRGYFRKQKRKPTTMTLFKPLLKDFASGFMLGAGTVVGALVIVQLYVGLFK